MVSSEEQRDNSIEINDTSNLDFASCVAIESDERKKVDKLEQQIKEVARGGGIAFIGNTIIRVTGFGVHVLLARVLGPGVYGLYALGVSVTGIAQSVSLLGLNQGIVRYCSIYLGEGDRARVKGTILSALGISFASSTLVAILLFVFAGVISERFFDKSDLINVLRIFALALPFYALTIMTAAFAQSFKRISYQQGLSIFRSLANLGLVGLAFLFGFRLGGAVYGFLGSVVLSAGLGFYILWRIFPEIWFGIVPSYQIKKLFRFSLPVFLTGISYLLLSYTDRIMLGYFGEVSGVGIYNVASTTSRQMTVFLWAFIAIFSPIIAGLHNRREVVELSNTFKTVTRWVTVLTLPIFFIFALYAGNIMRIFGSEFADGEIVLVILSTAQLVNIFTGPVGILLQMTGKQDFELVNGLALLLINIGLNVWLIPIHGVVGASLATAISLILIHAARLLETYIIFRISPYNQRYFITLLVGLAAGLIGMVLRTITPNYLLWHFIGGLITILIYVSILYALGLDPEDKYVLNTLKRKLYLRRF